MPFPWKKVKSSQISRLVKIPPEIPPEMEIAAASAKRKSRKAKIKSKMRKIVPKKLRSGKRDHDFGIVHDEEGEAMIDVNGSVSSSGSDNGEGEGEEDGGGSICSDRELEISEPVAARRSNMVLCLVALAGLAGGRPFALVLTLFCLLVFKLGQGFPVMVRNKV